jgi:hypothetical protein
MTEYYTTDPTDPYAPVELEEYRGIRVGDSVAYDNPDSAATLEGPLTVSALYRFPPGVQMWTVEYIAAVLNGGEYECSADNLRKEE